MASYWVSKALLPVCDFKVTNLPGCARWWGGASAGCPAALAPSRRPGCILPLVWDKILGTTRSHTLCSRPCVHSQQEVHCALWEPAAELTGACSRGASLLLHGQNPSFVLSLTHMLKLVGNLEWYYISPGSKETFTTSLMNLSQSFNNAAIYRQGLYWIDSRSCTKAHSVSAMKLRRNIRADWNHSV